MSKYNITKLNTLNMAPMATETLTPTAEKQIPLATSKTGGNGTSDKYSRTAGMDVGFQSPSKMEFKNKYEEREYIKGRLAAAYRIFGHFGLNEGIAGHITVRDPIEPDTFWVSVTSEGWRNGAATETFLGQPVRRGLQQD